MWNTSIGRVGRGLTKTPPRQRSLTLLGGSLVGGFVTGVGLHVERRSPLAQPRAIRSSVLTFPLEHIVLSKTQSFTGTGTVTSFHVVDGVLTATGTLAGKATGAAEPVAGTFSGPVSFDGERSCTAFDLTINPCDLTLGGCLVVASDAVPLRITALGGPRNPLCAVAALIDNPQSSLDDIANLLNEALALPR